MGWSVRQTNKKGLLPSSSRSQRGLTERKYITAVSSELMILWPPDLFLMVDHKPVSSKII